MPNVITKSMSLFVYWKQCKSPHRGSKASQSKNDVHKMEFQTKRVSRDRNSRYVNQGRFIQKLRIICVNISETFQHSFQTIRYYKVKLEIGIQSI